VPTAVVNSRWRRSARPHAARAASAFRAGRINRSLSMAALLIIVIIAVGYLVSLRIHPLRKCPRCNMSGRHYGAIFTGTYRRCRRCDGKGQLDRIGTQVFYGGTKHTGTFPKK
jgi:DnaJ-class molecular chaperone